VGGRPHHPMEGADGSTHPPMPTGSRQIEKGGGRLSRPTASSASEGVAGCGVTHSHPPLCVRLWVSPTTHAASGRGWIGLCGSWVATTHPRCWWGPSELATQPASLPPFFYFLLLLFFYYIFCFCFHMSS